MVFWSKYGPELCALNAEIRYIIIARVALSLRTVDQCYRGSPCFAPLLGYMSRGQYIAWYIYIYCRTMTIEGLKSNTAPQFLIARSKCPGLGGKSPTSHSV